MRHLAVIQRIASGKILLKGEILRTSMLGPKVFSFMFESRFAIGQHDIPESHVSSQLTAAKQELTALLLHHMHNSSFKSEHSNRENFVFIFEHCPIG